MTERVDSVGDLAEGESSSLGSSDEEETDPHVEEEVGSRNGGIFISIETYDYGHKYSVVSEWHLTTTYLQIFRYTSKQLESQKSYKICWLSFANIPTAHKTLKCQHRRR